MGVTIMGFSGISNIWVYMVANFLGGLVASLVFKGLNPDDK